MTTEAKWYQDYQDGRQPHSKRLCRMDMQFQWEAAIELAIAFAAGDAGYRKVIVSLTRERYWHWPHPLSASGWWLIPGRIERRAMHLIDVATRCELRRQHGGCDSDKVVARLRRWRKTGHWQRKVAAISGRRPDNFLTPVSKRSYGMWLESFEPRKKRARRRRLAQHD